MKSLSPVFARGLVIVFLLLSSLLLRSQSHFEGHFGVGQVITHTNALRFPPPSTGWLMQLVYLRPVAGNKDWQRYWKKPSIGGHILFTDLGNQSVLGYAVGIFPSLRFSLVKSHTVSVGLEVGSGLAWASRRYDVVNNPTNNAISTSLNNITQFRWLFTAGRPGWQKLQIGLCFTHFSNGHIHLPNKGLNQVAFSLGIPVSQDKGIWLSKTKQDSLPQYSDTQNKRLKKWGFDYLAGLGFTEYSFEGGPPYQTWFTSAGLVYRKNPYVHYLLGAEFEFNQSTFQFYYLDFEDRTTSMQKASRTALFSALALNFGMLSARAGVGVYMPFPQQSIISSLAYFKLSLQTAIPGFKKRVHPYAGISIKSHAAVAQYLGIYCGVGY